jgi:hypothetical protein
MLKYCHALMMTKTYCIEIGSGTAWFALTILLWLSLSVLVVAIGVGRRIQKIPRCYRHSF